MAACPQCGSRSVRLVINPLTWLAHLITENRASKCPRCGWRGWKHKKEWLHIPAAGILRGGTGHSDGEPGRRRRGSRVTPTLAPVESQPKARPAIPDEEFETVVRDGVEAPDFGAIDQNLSDAREKWAAERKDRGRRRRNHHH